MFYFKNWETFCSEISKLQILSIRANDILKGNVRDQFILFKHDVEANPIKALKLAEIENKYGIKGSYYIQAYLLEKAEYVDILLKIKNLGHEVSYHYDVLDANRGDIQKANNDFKIYVNKFRSHGFSIETVCQHGNPVMERVGYTSNRDFFRNAGIANQYKDLADIVVDFKYKTGLDYKYISDAGYSWKLISDPENNDRYETTSDIHLDGFKAILELASQGNSIILSTHPHRWKKSKIGIYSKILIFKAIRQAVQILRKFPGVEKIMSKFYFLAKKI